MTPRWLPALTVALAVGLVVSLAGWFFSTRTGAGEAIDCYSINNDVLSFSPVHAANTTKATFTVAESESKVVIGYWMDADRDVDTPAGSSADVSYVLTRPLGDRPVVDPAGRPIQNCDDLTP